MVNSQRLLEKLFLFVILLRASAEVLPNTANVVISASVLGIFLLRIVFMRGRLSFSRAVLPLYVAFGLFLLSLCASSLLGLDIKAGFSIVLKYAVQFVCLYMGVEFSRENPSFRDNACKVILLSSLVPLLAGLIQQVTNQGFVSLEMRSTTRAVSFFAHPAQYSLYLLIIFSCAVYLLLYRRQWRLFSLVILGLSAMQIFYSYTRVTWLTLAATIFLHLFIMEDKRLRAVVAGGGVVAVALLWTTIMERFSNLSETSSEKNSMITRFSMWGKIVARIGERPFLGHGPDTTQLVVNNEAHNEYLKAVFEYGAVGAFFFFVFLGVAVAYLFNRRRDKYAVSILVLFLTFLVSSLTDNVFNSLVLQMYLWTLIGCAIAPRREVLPSPAPAGGAALRAAALGGP